MRAPGFWDRDGPLPRLLSPLGMVYAAATARRAARPGLRLPVPVISVGNLSAGGTGKTPVVMDLMERLSSRGISAHVISRGYGGRAAGPVRVDPSVHPAAEVGDEPLLLAAWGPVWVSRDRAAGGTMAVEAGAEALLLDDAHQNPALAKDLSIVVVDAEAGFGNGCCIPAGPLREPVGNGLARAGLVALLGPPEARAARRATIPAIPIAEGALAPLPTGMDWGGLRAVAFAGIGRPSKFFASLRAEGADIVRAVPLADHQPISTVLMQRLAAEAHALGARLVCTEKDAVRVPDEFRDEVLVLPVRVSWSDAAPLDAALDRILSGLSESRAGGTPQP